MRMFKVVLPAAILMGFTLIVSTASYGKPEYAKKEGKQCNFCHGKMGSKEEIMKNFTDAGKYYSEHNHSLDGYKK